jgi:hypothetical protein
MYNWFECKVTYDKTLENGTQKKVTEPYLVDALSFTEAEARIIEELKPYISGDFTIADIKRAKLSELFFNENGDRYFKAKIYFITLDEKTGTEKKTAALMLVQASDLKEALSVVEKGMEGTMADYVIASLSETAIIDVFPYSSDESKTVVVTFENNEKEIDKTLLNQDSFDIDFDGVLLVKFEKRDLGLIAVNAVDGHGNNQKDFVFGKLLKYKR